MKELVESGIESAEDILNNLIEDSETQDELGARLFSLRWTAIRILATMVYLETRDLGISEFHSIQEIKEDILEQLYVIRKESDDE